METVSIRDLRGADLQESARKGKPLAVTNHRVLIGVIIPVASAWVEHLIYYNWSHVGQSIAEGEQAVANGAPMATIHDVMGGASATGSGEGQTPDAPGSPAIPLEAVLVGKTVVPTPESKETLDQLQAALNPSGSAGQGVGPAERSVRTVRIGDLSAAVIERAGAAGQTLAITHERELIGILIPVTQNLVQFLIEQNISRVLYNIHQGEKELTIPGTMTTLDREIPPGSARPGPSLTAGIPETGIGRPG